MKHLDFSPFRLMIGGAFAVGIAGLMPIAHANQVLPVPVAPASIDNPSPQTTEAQPPSLADGWRSPEFVRSLTGHIAPIDTLAFSPDGKILLSGGSTNDGQIKLWWLRSGKEIESLRAHRMSVMGLLFSQDGNTLASIGDDGGVNLWKWKTGNFDSAMGNYTRTFLDHTSNLLAMAMTPDSQTLVTGGLDGIRVWDLRTQRPLYNMVRFDNQTYSLAVNPNGDILASGHKFGTIKLWSLSNGAPLGSISAHTSPANPISALAFTPNGLTLVSGSYDRTIQVRDIRTGQLMHVLRGHTGRIQSIAINPDGETLASASRDGVRLWNLRTGELLTVLTGHQDWVRSVAFNRDGSMLATGGFDREIIVWRLPTNPDR
ncbi:MAG TPA: WD40 repeat domain-containing protein [Coleofasciculaceae cyanobacterium]